jgi:hypothetical protein
MERKKTNIARSRERRAKEQKGQNGDCDRVERAAKANR